MNNLKQTELKVNNLRESSEQSQGNKRMDLKKISFTLILLTAVAYAAPITKSSENPDASFQAEDTTTPIPHRAPPPARQRPMTEEDVRHSVNHENLQTTAQNVSRSSLESRQAASILLSHLEDVLLMGFEVPPSPPCFMEERDPFSVEHPHPDTDFQGRLEEDYSSLLKYQQYLASVKEDNEKLSTPVVQTNSSDDSESVYVLEFFGLTNTVSVLEARMRELLEVLDTSVPNTKGETMPTGLPDDCYETCYGQQVSVLRNYITLVFYYIPGDVAGLLDSNKE